MYCKLFYFKFSFICKYAIQPLTRSYKICIGSVILGELQPLKLQELKFY